MSLADELQKLEQLRQAGTLSTAEFAQAKATLLNTTISITDSGKLVQLTKEAELARIDREWELEKQSFNVLSRYGIQQRPTERHACHADLRAMVLSGWLLPNAR